MLCFFFFFFFFFLRAVNKTDKIKTIYIMVSQFPYLKNKQKKKKNKKKKKKKQKQNKKKKQQKKKKNNNCNPSFGKIYCWVFVYIKLEY